MKRLLNAFGATLLITFSHIAYTQDAYVCITDKSSGFKFDTTTKKWDAATFRIDEEKFIIKREKNNLKYPWKVSPVGQPYPISTCEKDFTDAGYLFCTGFEDFRFNKKNLRFMSAYLLGYIDGAGQDEGKNTPAIKIGKCSPL